MLIADPEKTMALRIFSRLTFVKRAVDPIQFQIPFPLKDQRRCDEMPSGDLVTFWYLKTLKPAFGTHFFFGQYSYQ